MKTIDRRVEGDKRIGINIRSLREENGMTQSEFAEILDVTRSCVANWETGARIPDCNFVKKIAAVFHVPMDHIYGITNHKYNIHVPDYFELDFRKLNPEGMRELHNFYKYLTWSEKYSAK